MKRVDRIENFSEWKSILFLHRGFYTTHVEKSSKEPDIDSMKSQSQMRDVEGKPDQLT